MIILIKNSWLIDRINISYYIPDRGIEKEIGGVNMNIEISEIGKEELVKVLESKSTKKPLRIYVASYGWAGPNLGLALDEQKESDVTISADGFDFVIDDAIADMYSTFQVDYSNSWIRKGFVVTGDNIVSTC